MAFLMEKGELKGEGKVGGTKHDIESKLSGLDCLQTVDSISGIENVLLPIENDNYSSEADCNSMDASRLISIPQLYAGRSVFITGGTGFIGKVLVEKLLRSCPDIKNIYLLMRPKRGQNVSARLKSLLNLPLFDKLRHQQPKALNKVISISGEITSEQLGISENDQALLCRTVSIVFHSAATVKFDEKLKLSVTINMLGTKRLVELCHRMKSLDALIHVSTAYCNCDRTEVSEVIYEAPYNPDDIISLINWLPEDMLDKLTPSLIGKRPNTYTFTKALAEQMLLKEADNLPIAIVRPSIVIASLNEPFPGWVDNYNGPNSLVTAIGRGTLRTILCEPNFVADMVPVDVVVNLMIAVTWHTATQKLNKLLAYNCCSGKQHPITWSKFAGTIAKYSRKHPMEDCFLCPSVTLRMSRSKHLVQTFFTQLIPAYIYDYAARLLGKKAIMIATQHALYRASRVLEYFCTHQWCFNDDNVQNLISTLGKEDRENFVFDVRSIDWEEYIERYVLGFRQFLFKQHPKSIPASRKRIMRIYWMQQISKIVLVIFTWRFLMVRSKRIRDLWTRFLQIARSLVRLLQFF